MNPHIVILDTRPGRVFPRRTPVGFPEAIAPVVPAHKIPARPAIHRRVEFLEHLHRVFPPPLDVVAGHQRCGRNPEFPRPFRDNLETPLVGRSARLELDRILGILRLQGVNFHRFAVFGTFAPDQAHFDRSCRGVTRQDHPPHILLILHQTQFFLRQTGRFARQGEFRRLLILHVHFFLLHLQGASLSHDQPRRRHQNPGLFFCLSPRLAHIARHGIEKLAIHQHFGPRPPINTLPEMLHELPIHILGNRFARLGRVNADFRAFGGEDLNPHQQTSHCACQRISPPPRSVSHRPCPPRMPSNEY